MDLKTLPFNKALLKKDWKLTKWLCFLVAGILFFSFTLNVINTYNNYLWTLNRIEEHPEEWENFKLEEYKESVREDLRYRFKGLEGMEIPLTAFIPMLVAALLFGDEKRKKTFELLSSMPFTRWEIFFNKGIAALINVVAPFLLNASILIVALGFSKGLRELYSVGMVMSWLGGNAFRLFAMLSFSLLFASLAGTFASQLVLTIIFFIFPVGFAGLIDMNMSIWGYRSHMFFDFLDTFSKYTMLGLFDSIENVPIVYHVILAVIMLIAAKYLFDRNKLERSGETLEFESIETFFKIGVTGCVALLVGVLFTGIFRGSLLLSNLSLKVLVIIGYIIGTFLGWLIANYSISFNKVKV